VNRRAEAQPVLEKPTKTWGWKRFSEGDLRKVAYENVIRVLKANFE